MVRSAVVVTRHGDRTPLKIFTNTLSKWPGLGTLTPVGIQQHFQLGLQYRKRIDPHNLISPIYQDKQVYFKATGKQRTLLSASSFAFGFYPTIENSGLPSGNQPVPIYSTDTDKDKILYAYKTNDILKGLRSETKRSDVWVEKEKESEKYLTALSEIVGEQVKLDDVTSIWNIAEAERVHNQPTLKELNDHDIQSFLSETSDFVLRRKFANQLMGVLGVGELLKFILGQFQKKLIGQGPNFTMLSGHDGTLLALFASLNCFDFALPHYGASICFELLEEDSNPTIKMSFYPAPTLDYPRTVLTWSLSEFSFLVNEQHASIMSSVNNK